jgi:hypothetical protein
MRSHECQDFNPTERTLSMKIPPKKRPDAAHAIAKTFFGASGNAKQDRHLIQRYLVGVPGSLIIIPLLFYIGTGQVGPLGWGLAIFLGIYCLLAATGLHFLHRPEYHSPVALRGGWADRIGAFWLMACAFGPFLSWVLLNVVPVTLENWRWVYGIQVFLSIILPVMTAVPMLRYVKGKGAPIMLLILLGVTSLPVFSALPALRDLPSGPVREAGDLYLPFTGRWLEGP